MHWTSHKEMSKNCSRTWQELNLSPFVSRKTNTSKLGLQREPGSLCLYQFLSRQTWTRIPFSPQRQSSSSHLIFYHCSRRISNSKQSSDEIEFLWTRDCTQDKLVCYSATTQPKTQPSREGVKFLQMTVSWRRKWIDIHNSCKCKRIN